MIDPNGYGPPLTDIYYHVESAEFLNILMQPNVFHARLNDGEYSAILEPSVGVKNSHGDFYFPGLSDDLRYLLLEHIPSPHYVLSGAVYWFRDWPRYRTLLSDMKAQNHHLRMAYVNWGDVGVDLLTHPLLYENFLSFLRQKSVVVVGPAYLRALKLFDRFDLIELPRQNAYTQKDAIIQKIVAHNATGVPTNYCFMGGLMAKTIIHHFSKVDTVNSYYDIGSSWDFFFQSSPTYDWPRGWRRQWYFEIQPTHSQFYRDYIV